MSSAASMNVEPPPSDMAKAVPQLNRVRYLTAKSLQDSKLVGYDACTARGCRTDEVGQELAPRVWVPERIAGIAHISGQLPIPCNDFTGQEIGHPDKM
jgi:hypothetical protein